MFNGFNTVGFYEMTSNSNHCCDNSEELGQRHGILVTLPTLRDRIALRTGELLITIGTKLTAASGERIRLSEEPA